MTLKDKIAEIEDASAELLVPKTDGEAGKTIKEMIKEIEAASGMLLVPKKEKEHIFLELVKDLLEKTTTLEEIEQYEEKYKEHFDGDEILEVIHNAKVKKGFISE